MTQIKHSSYGPQYFTSQKQNKIKTKHNTNSLKAIHLYPEDRFQEVSKALIFFKAI